MAEVKQLNVVRAKVGQDIEVTKIPHTLESIQEQIGGWMETVRIADDLLLVINEEGLLMDLPVNFVTCVIDRGTVQVVHEIHGDVFFVGVLGEDFHSLDKEQVQRVKKMFRQDRSICIAAVR